MKLLLKHTISTKISVSSLFCVERISGDARGKALSQPAITCSTLTIETLEQSVKYVQS